MKRLITIALLTILSIFNYSYGKVYDSIGKEFEERKYSKIISLAPSITETLMFLGISNEIVGITRYCPKLNDKSSIVGGFYDPDIEKIVSLKPDIVFMLKAGSIENYYKLIKLGINVFVLDYPSIDDIENNMLKLSMLLKLPNTNKVQEFKKELTRKTKALSEVIKDKKILVMYSYPLIYTASSNSYVASLIRSTGAINVSDTLASTYQTVTIGIETLVKLSPDIIIITEPYYEDIEKELRKLGIKSKFIYIPPQIIAPSPLILMALDIIHSSLTNK
jgi:iron complex transport system substrate-binding protein